MVDMKAKPFYLSDEDCKWVEETIAGMTTEEKIGQLFFNIADFLCSLTKQFQLILCKLVADRRYPLQPGNRCRGA